MLCRVLLVVTVLTCTFQRECSAEPDDVICVLVLSGLQKEDLDVNLLKKLQRHNVNIDNLNNEDVIERCIRHASSEKPTTNISPPIDNDGSTLSDGNEQTNSARIRKLIYNFTTHDNNNNSKPQDIEAETRNENMSHDTKNKTMLENFVELIIAWSKLKEDEKTAPETEQKKLTLPITLSKDLKIDSQPKEFDYINQMFNTFIATRRSQDVTTQPTTTTKVLSDIISEKIKKYLENSYDKSLQRVAVSEFTEYENDTVQKAKGDEQSLDVMQVSINYINELLNQKELSNTSDPMESIPAVIQQNRIKENIKNYTRKTFSDTIIKEITENVKASLLKDLQKQASSRTLETTTKINIRKGYPIYTPKAVQNASSVLESLKVILKQFKIYNNSENKTVVTTPSTVVQFNQDEINNASRTLQNFMKILQQLRNVTDVIPAHTNVKYTLTQTKTTNTAINLYPGPPVNFAYDVNTQVKLPVFIDSSRPILQLNHPEILKSKVSHQIVTENIYVKKRIDNLSDFNLFPVINIGSKIAQRPAAISIIQTDANEVPPLGIPVPNSVRAINQNIVVTTKNPMENFRDKFDKHRNAPIGFNYHESYAVSDGRYDTDYSKRQSYTDYTKRLSDTDFFNRQPDTDYLKRQHDNDYSKRQYDNDYSKRLSDTDFSKRQPDKGYSKRQYDTDYSKRLSDTDFSKRQSDASYSKRQPDNDYLKRQYDTDYSKRLSDTEFSKRQSDIDSGRSYYSDTEKEKIYNSDMERSYGRERTPQRGRYIPHKRIDRVQDITRNRQGSNADNFYKEYLSIVKPQSSESMISRDRNKERFHEKLENPRDWRSNYKRNKPKQNKRLSVITRTQLGLKDLKKKARENDSHFEDFLKTQQKVNNMLEKILATGLPDKVRSAETAETVYTAFRH